MRRRLVEDSYHAPSRRDTQPLTSRSTRPDLIVEYLAGPYEAPVVELRKALEAGFSRVQVSVVMADALCQTGRIGEAKEICNSAIEAEAQYLINRKDHEIRAPLSISLAGVERCDEARRHNRALSKNAPLTPCLDYLLAVSYSLCRNTETARSHVRSLQRQRHRRAATASPCLPNAPL